jgi:TIR domain
MSDIFISYSRVDYAKAEQLADVLKADWSVWWDPKILPGESFDDVIREELEKAKAVVVLWSSSSVKSAWVKDEADYALKKGILVPALVEAVEIPFGFRRIEAANLIDWHGDGSNLEYKNLKSAITKKTPLRVTEKLTTGWEPKWPPTLFSGLPGAEKISEGTPEKSVRPKPISLWMEELTKLGKQGAPAKTGVIFEDHFEDNRNNWSEKRDHQQMVMRVRNGRYNLEHKGRGSWYTWKNIVIDQNRDFEIETEIAHAYTTSLDSNETPFYGVMWGGKDVDNLFVLMLSYDGKFSYQKCVADDWRVIIPWTSCYAFKQVDLKPSFEARNKVTIRKQSKIIEFRVNDTWVEDAEFEAFFGNNVGFGIWRNFEISVEHIKVTQH